MNRYRALPPDGFSDEKTWEFLNDVRASVDVNGPRVRVLSSRCQSCGEDGLAGTDMEGETWTVAAAVLRALATQAHHDTCPGPVQFETEPVS